MINQNKLKLIFIAVVILSMSCNNGPKNKDRTLTESEKLEVANIVRLTHEQGLARLKNYCYSCHNPQSESHDKMLAPPLAGIKFNYLSTYPDSSLFVSQMADFIANPMDENAIMRGPVKRFGLMPKTALSKPEIQELVLFILENNIEVPNWFPSHFEDQHGEKWNGK